MLYYKNMSTFPENTSKQDMKLREYYKQEGLLINNNKDSSLSTFILYMLLKRF